MSLGEDREWQWNTALGDTDGPQRSERPGIDITDRIERPFILIGRSRWVIRRLQLPKAFGSRDLPLILSKLSVQPKRSLGTFVGNGGIGFVLHKDIRTRRR